MADTGVQDGLREWYEAFGKRAAANPDMTLEVIREAFEQIHQVGSEAPGVSYADDDANGVPVLWAIPAGGAQDRVILYFHGGGFVFGSRYSHRKLAAHLANAAGVPVAVVEYRLAPEHPFPACIDDAQTVYRWLLGKNIQPAHMATCGDSAGGNLCTSAVLRLRDSGDPLPAAIAPISPWYDLELKLSGLDERAATDAIVQRPMVDMLAGLYLGESGSRADPLANPLHADPAGLPPMLFSVGGYETIADNAWTFAERAKAAGVDVTVEETPERQHVFQFASGRHPDADASLTRIGAWLRTQLGL